MSSILGCTTKEAHDIIENFYNGNPGLRDLKAYIERFYRRHKYIKGVDGRKLFIRSEHILLNSLIQGSAAILFKKWGCNIWNKIDELDLSAKIIIAYHDEYELRVHKDEIEVVKELLKETLRNVQEYYKISVELDTDTKVGRSWADVH